ncbi:MFS transporter [Neobacillus sp. LXY-1]|uniref:MFS transporter n=1 Tax=Neobacillus sp. LXY-1 TaxID=3379133 RepID=UPI003EE37D69
MATESLYGLSIGMFNLLLNLHLIELGISERQIGLITSIGILVMGLFAIPVSILAKKTGRKKLLIIGIGCIAVGCSVFAFSKSFALFLTAQFIVSLGLTLVETTEIQLLFYYCRSIKEETQAYSFMFAVFTAFTGVGTLMAGLLPDWIDLTARGYRNTLLVAAFVFIVLAVVRAALLPKEQLGNSLPIVQKNLFIRIPHPLRKKLIWFSLFAFVTGGAAACLQPYLNLFAKFRYDFPNEIVSIILALNGLALFIGSVISPFLIERMGLKKTFFLIYSVNMVLCGLLFLNVQPFFFSVLLVIRGGFFTILTNLADSLSMSSFKDEERDLYAGMRAVFRSIGSAMAAFAIGGILADRNYTLPFFISGLLLLLGYLYFVIVIAPKLDNSNQEVHEAINEI